jgi:hypothetical protein
VQLAPGAEATGEELQRHCRGELARYKVPDEVRVVDVLEVSTTGKVVKAPLREPSGGEPWSPSGPHPGGPCASGPRAPESVPGHVMEMHRCVVFAR